MNVKSLKIITDKIGRTVEHCFYCKKHIIKNIGKNADHCFRYGSSQWALPIEKTYNKLIEYYNIDKMNNFRTYKDLKKEYENLKEEYKKYLYTFNKKEGLINCLEYSFLRKKNIHNTPKPIQLIEDLIKISSNENDIVLDCFLGSGTTYNACKNLNRICFGCEIEQKYYDLFVDITSI
ncbi:MAG TPA: site-specific DNA-methyltransferase [Sulfurovum sp.]|nr:site-specific DNA-methyltransferase [Sulfurovum sp.]